MKKLHAITAIAVLAIGILGLNGCTSAVAQEQVNPETRRTITVSGTGSTRVKPDLATAIVGVTKSAPKLPDAKSATDAAIAKVHAALKKAGVKDEDIQTTQYQIYRVEANPQAGIRESVWKVVHMFLVRTKSPDRIAAIVDSAVAAGATDVRNIGFTVDNLAQHRKKSRELATAAAKEKALQLAQLLDVNVGKVISIVETGEYYPMAQMSANARFDSEADGFGGSGIAGGQVEVSTNIQVVFEIR